MSGEDIYYKGDSDYWKAYREGRPRVPDSYFERIIEYHARNGGEFNVWHDMGAGSAVHTRRLAPKFKTTIVSDSGASNVEAAKTYLGEDDSYKFRVAKGEEAADLEPGTVDLVFGANMIHYTDVDETLRAVLHQLKPGGTLALGGFGLPILLDPELQNLWAEVIHRRFEVTFESNRSAVGLFVQASSPHDAVPFDTQYFRSGALRLKFNERNGWSWRRCMVPKSLDESIPHVTRFGEEDVIVHENNDDWSFEADITVMRKILETFPLPPDPVRDNLWRQLEIAFGGRVVPATWPSSLTLVTKR
ncbi:S-adenosyl-L-methionine-dependent methyltransferase [Paraphoma chrysanthemicola]|uniref:S-adenosyl-L-methionine-dependent methyltransferase n=1 Tax=Paraphoma chrysanthemicola TaxID=798071 RepID=A0A8K0R3N6_9PLEO|nr:S-adenosyl-L-methionine-dependent methyltransferase [Paraphoma chrysanthemicola]